MPGTGLAAGRKARGETHGCMREDSRVERCIAKCDTGRIRRGSCLAPSAHRSDRFRTAAVRQQEERRVCACLTRGPMLSSPGCRPVRPCSVNAGRATSSSDAMRSGAGPAACYLMGGRALRSTFLPVRLDRTRSYPTTPARNDQTRTVDSALQADMRDTNRSKNGDGRTEARRGRNRTRRRTSVSGYRYFVPVVSPDAASSSSSAPSCFR